MILLGLMEAAAGPSVAGEALSVARGISEYGILVVVAAFFLVLAGGTMVWHMKSYRKLMDSVVKDFADSIDSVRDIAERNRQTMADIAEALTPETRSASSKCAASAGANRSRSAMACWIIWKCFRIRPFLRLRCAAAGSAISFHPARRWGFGRR